MRYQGSNFAYVQADLNDLQQRIVNALKRNPGSSSDNVIIPAITGVTPLEIKDAGGTRVQFTSTGTVFINPNQIQPAIVLGPNALNQLVTGLNADLFDGFNSDAYLTTVPVSPTRNLVFCGSTITPIIAGIAYPGQTYRLIQIVDAAISEIFAVTHDGSIVIAPNTPVSPINLGTNATGRLVTGLNADLLDGYHASAFRLTGTAISHGNLSNLTLDDHIQYVVNGPETTSRNVIEARDDIIPLRIKPWSGGHTENLFECVDGSDNPYAYVNANYKVFGIGLDAGNEKVTAVANPTIFSDAVNLGYLTGNYRSYTGSTSTGTILVGNGTAFTGLPIGANDQVLAVTGNTLAWKTQDYSWSYWYGFERRPVTAAVTGGAFTLAVADVSLANATDEDGFTMGRTAADGNITYLAWQFACPNELDITSPVHAVVYARLPGAGSNQIEFQSRARAVNSSETMLGGGTYRETDGTLGLTGYSSDALITVPISTVFAAGDISSNDELLKGSIVRDATSTNASDTYANSVIVIGVKFYGKKNKWS